jgi:hypothetical protein
MVMGLCRFPMSFWMTSAETGGKRHLALAMDFHKLGHKIKAQNSLEFRLSDF